MKEDRYYSRSYSRQQKTINVVIQIVLLVLGIMWILPLMWIILTSFRAEPGSYTSYFWPKGFTLDNYMRLLFEDQQFKFSQWFLNTFIVAVVSCIGSTFIVLAVSYALSRLRFKMRKPMMNVALILGMFPGFMSMVAIYYILKGLGLTENPLVCLTLVYISGSHTTISGLYLNRAAATARIAPVSGSTPIFTASTRISENTASSWSAMTSCETLMLDSSACVFSAKTEVITLIP